MRSLTLVALLATLAGAVQAQEGAAKPNTREGFWIGFGLGVGSAGAECDACSDDRDVGFSGHLRMGGTISSKVLLGGESNGWARSESGVDQTLGYASFILMWYPSATGAFYLKFGLGGMSYKADDGINDLTATAPSASFGLGYDFRIGTNFSITPFLNSLGSAPVDVKFNGVSVPADNISVNLLQIGVGVSWH